MSRGLKCSVYLRIPISTFLPIIRDIIIHGLKMSVSPAAAGDFLSLMDFGSRERASAAVSGEVIVTDTFAHKSSECQGSENALAETGALPKDYSTIPIVAPG